MSKINLVSLSGEQLWPTIHSIAHYGENIDKLFLLHSEDEVRSAKPARSIRNFVVQWNKNIKVIMPSSSIKSNPADVSNALNQWMEQYPSEQWVINASGGTKLMLLGVLDFANLNNVQIIYRDLVSKNWHALSRIPDLGFLKTDRIEIAEDVTDSISVEKLVETIWSDSGNFIVKFGTDLPDIDSEKTTKIASLNDWNFKKAFESLGYPAECASGQLFEQYIVSILKNLGIKNVTYNAVKQLHNGFAISEIDIIANHNGSLTIIDCKMRGIADEEKGKTESFFEQIRKAYQVGNELGGLGAKIILLRPNRVLSENERLLASSYRIDVIDSPKISNIVDLLASHFNISDIPQTLLNLQKIILDSQSNQIYAGLGSASFKNDWDNQTRQSGILDFNREITKLRNDLGQEWSIFLLDNQLFVDFPIPVKMLKLENHVLSDQILDKLQILTQRMADLEMVNLSPKRGRVKVSYPQDSSIQIRRFFQSRFGKPLF